MRRFGKRSAVIPPQAPWVDPPEEGVIAAAKNHNNGVPPCPPYQDMATLCANICLCEATVESHVKRGILPPPRLIGGKRLWKWTEVEAYLDRAQSSVPDELAERIRNDTDQAIAEMRPLRRRKLRGSSDQPRAFIAAHQSELKAKD